jgi:hypothetical protein
MLNEVSFTKYYQKIEWSHRKMGNILYRHIQIWAEELTAANVQHQVIGAVDLMAAIELGSR